MLMREMARLGHKCLIITSDANHLTEVPQLEHQHMIETVQGVDVCWVQTRKYTGAKSVGRVLSWLHFEWRLWRLPKRIFRSPDAIIVSSLSLLTILNGFWLRRRFRCRLIFEVRDIWPLTIIEEGGFSPRNPFVLLLGFIERLAYRKADAIVGTMPNLNEHVNEQVSFHAPVFTIPFGVDRAALTSPSPVPQSWIEKYLPKDRFIVCYAGTIGITNALDTFFNCARDMANHEDIHFLVVGEGDLKAEYEALCTDLPNVTFAEPVPKAMVQSVIARCDLLYFSTHTSKVWRYGASLNKMIDYMLAAKPVVGSYTGFRTMIEDAQSGSIVPAGDAVALKAEILRYAAMSAGDREVIGAKGREWLLRNRDYSDLAQRYSDIALADPVKAQSHCNRG